METINQFLLNNIVTESLGQRIAASIFVILFVWLLKLIAIKVVNKKKFNKKQRYRVQKGISYFLLIVAFVLLGTTWFSAFGTLSTFLGIFTAGLAVVFKDPITSFAGWGYIIWKRPFILGDRIELNGIKGDVVDIGALNFTLLEIGNWVNADQSTGRMIQFPNLVVFANTIANYTKGFTQIWVELPMTFTFESDWKLAQKNIQKILDEHTQGLHDGIEDEIRKSSQEFFIHYTNFDSIVYTSIDPCGVTLTSRYLCPPKLKRSVEHQISEALLVMVEKHKSIELAYPTQRIVGEISTR